MPQNDSSTRGIPARADDRHPLEGQRRIRPRQQRRVLLLLRHGDQRLADRRGRPRHPPGRDDRRLCRIRLPFPRVGRLPRDRSGRACVWASWATPASGTKSDSFDEDGEPLAEGRFVHVFVGREDRRPREGIPASVREAMAEIEPMRRRASVLREMGQAVALRDSRSAGPQELTPDHPGKGELLVRVKAAGLCQSDLSVIDGSRPRMMPMALGHEAAGEVVKAGSGDSVFSAGDHVVSPLYRPAATAGSAWRAPPPSASRRPRRCRGRC